MADQLLVIDRVSDSIYQGGVRVHQKYFWAKFAISVLHKHEFYMVMFKNRSSYSPEPTEITKKDAARKGARLLRFFSP